MELQRTKSYRFTLQISQLTSKTGNSSLHIRYKNQHVRPTERPITYANGRRVQLPSWSVRSSRWTDSKEALSGLPRARVNVFLVLHQGRGKESQYCRQSSRVASRARARRGMFSSICILYFCVFLRESLIFKVLNID